ncbi:hypothetical protein GCM10022631_35010 [Deinococcus rubellus]
MQQGTLGPGGKKQTQPHQGILDMIGGVQSGALVGQDAGDQGGGDIKLPAGTNDLALHLSTEYHLP